MSEKEINAKVLIIKVCGALAAEEIKDEVAANIGAEIITEFDIYSDSPMTREFYEFVAKRETEKAREKNS